MKSGENFFSKVLVGGILIIWVAIVGGGWLGRFIVKQEYLGKQDEAVEFREMPSPRPRPWVSVDPELKREIEELRAESDRKKNPLISKPLPEITSTPAVKPKPDQSGSFRLQFGAFSDRKNAEDRVAELTDKGESVELEKVKTDEGTVFRVKGNAFHRASEAQAAAESLKEKGIQVFVVND